MKKLILILLLLFVAQSFAEQSPERDPTRSLFPPDKIMENSEELGLTQEQKKEVHEIVQKLQPKLMEYQEELQDSQKLVSKALSVYPTSFSKVEPFLRSMFQEEGEMKLLHIKMLLEVRNILSAEQVEILKSIK